MSKRGLTVCLSLGLLLLFCACTSAMAPATGDGPGGVITDTLEDILIHTEQAVYHPGEKEVTIILYDAGKNSYTFDMEYMLQVLDGDRWVDVDKGDTIIWIQATYPLDPGDTAEQSLALSSYTDDIKPGQYRIVKPIHSVEDTEIYYMTAVFTVGRQEGD